MTLDRAIEIVTQAYTREDGESFILQPGRSGILGVSQIEVIEAWKVLREHAEKQR